MSIRTVAAKDFASTSRSRALWAFAVLLALLFAAVAYNARGFREPAVEVVTGLFRTLATALALLLPIVALVASYMAVAGARERGSIKFLLSVPNTRGDVFLGKLASRLVVVGGGVCLVFAAAASVAVAKHGVLPVRLVVGLFVLSLVYGSVFVAVAVALSAGVASQSRAIATAIAAYFGLVVLYVVPVVRVSDVVQRVHTEILGFEANQNLYDAAAYTSPYVAYRKAANLVLPPGEEFSVFYRSPDAGDLPGYLADEVSLAVFAAWLALPVALGYLRFQRIDLE